MVNTPNRDMLVTGISTVTGTFCRWSFFWRKQNSWWSSICLRPFSIRPSSTSRGMERTPTQDLTESTYKMVIITESTSQSCCGNEMSYYCQAHKTVSGGKWVPLRCDPRSLLGFRKKLGIWWNVLMAYCKHSYQREWLGTGKLCCPGQYTAWWTMNAWNISTSLKGSVAT